MVVYFFLGLVIYNLDGQPKEYKRVEPPLKYQHRCIAIFKDKKTPAQPTGKSPCEIFFHRVLKNFLEPAMFCHLVVLI